MNTFKKLIAVAVMSMCAALAQSTGTPVVMNDGPNQDQHTVISYVSGTTTYMCYARPYQATASTVTMTGISNAGSAVVTATAHGFHADASPLVTFSGATGSWTALNTTFRATVVDANTLSIPLNSTSFGALTGTVVMKTNAPRTSNRIWLILRMKTDGTNFTSKMWAQGGANACDDRATLAYQ